MLGSRQVRGANRALDAANFFLADVQGGRVLAIPPHAIDHDLARGLHDRAAGTREHAEARPGCRSF